MKNNYLLRILFVFGVLTLISCSDSEDDDSQYVPVSPVVLDVTQVPYEKLSDYHFFEGALSDQSPSYKVLPYQPASELFSDYAHKMRFVWMPPGTKATWNGADNALEFPVGAVLIKTFYYDNVQPENVRKYIETRLLIKKRPATATNSGWETYNYIWNEEQTEAFLDIDGNGIFIPITWNESGAEKSIYYKVPAFTECRTCHKLNPTQTQDGEITVPIGVKPQGLNNSYNYGSVTQNQLQKWIAEGYLENNIPSNFASAVDWKDTSQPLELRARSYIDINCAHCHREGAHCDYTPMRFDFSNTDPAKWGVCVPITQPLAGFNYIIQSGNPDNSELVHRISTNNQFEMMPIIGRTIIHEEGVQLIRDWISARTEHCE